MRHEFNFGQGAQWAQFPAGHGWKEVNKAISQETKCLERLFYLRHYSFHLQYVSGDLQYMSRETYNMSPNIFMYIYIYIYVYIFLCLRKHSDIYLGTLAIGGKPDEIRGRMLRISN